jgi:hypothetical protein
VTRLGGRITEGQRGALYEVLGRGRVTGRTINEAPGKRLKAILKHYLDESEKARER